LLISPPKAEQRLLHRCLKLSSQLFRTELLAPFIEAPFIEDAQQPPNDQDGSRESD